MKIYKMIYHKKKQGLFESYADTKTYWDLNPKEGSEIVTKENDCTLYDTQYAVEKNTENMSVEDLMYVMYKKLSTDEVKCIFKSDEVIKQMFLAYLANPMRSEEVQKMLKEIKSSADGAEAMAAISLMSDVLN